MVRKKRDSSETIVLVPVFPIRVTLLKHNIADVNVLIRSRTVLASVE